MTSPRALLAVLAASFTLGAAAPAPTIEERGMAVMRSRCGACHGVTVGARCVAGECAARSHAIEPRPWPLVLSWMQALGCQLSEAERTDLERFLMSRYAKVAAMTWEPLEPVPEGWNVVALQSFRERLYAGIEGAGSALRLEGRAWRPVLTTDSYTVYGLITFRDRVFAGTNQPRAEVWSSGDGEHWTREATLPPEERGIVALGVFGDALYAGTTRGRVYRSSDGRAWSPAGALLADAENGFANWVRFLVSFDGRLYAGVEGTGVFVSRDGTTWTSAHGASGPSAGVRAAVVSGGRLYVGTTSRGEIWRTAGRDRGWERVFAASTGTRTGYVAALADAADSLFASVNGRVLRSRDGRSWDEVGELTPFTVEAMHAFAGSLYAGTTLPPRAWVYRGALDGGAPRRTPPATP
ncbi:MAG: hypothetical protein ACOYXU_00615 [Nitrospirota bacterium]